VEEKRKDKKTLEAKMDNDTFVYGTKNQVVIAIANIEANKKPVGITARDWARIKKAYAKRANRTTKYCSTNTPVQCDKTVYLAGKCRACYNRYYYMEPSIKLIAAFAGEPDATMLLRSKSWIHSANPLMYHFRRKCSTVACNSLCVLTYPFCSTCSCEQFGLGVVGSLIPGSGFGLIATKDFRAKERLGLIYGKQVISRAEKEEIEASTDPLQQTRMNYLIQLSKDTFIDGFGEEAGILRFINNAPNHSLVNCRFVADYTSRTVSVETTKNVPAGCEFLLVYRFTAAGYGVYWNKICSDSAARLVQRKQIIAAMKHGDS